MKIISHASLCCCAVLSCVTFGVATASADESRSFDVLVEQLDHNEFLKRRSASQKLVAAATAEDDTIAEQVTAALRDGLLHRSVEVRLATANALREIEQVRRDQQTERLLNPRTDPDSIQLAGWREFSAMAGQDMPARRLFAAIDSSYPQVLRDIDRGADDEVLRQHSRRLDPFHLPAEDAVNWSLALMLDAYRSRYEKSEKVSSRVGVALSSSAMGPKIISKSQATVVQRLIDHWVDQRITGASIRERLQISMRYQCHTRAAQLCEEIFDDPNASPSTQVMALLASAALERNDTEMQARLRLTDDRTAHVWQLIASRKTKIRTQVADVALAVLLQHHGIDPRRVGFAELQADPILMFREHSLGFPDQESRRQSRKEAARLMEERVSELAG